MVEIAFWNRLGVRLALLILVIVLVLAGATGVLVYRGFVQTQRAPVLETPLELEGVPAVLAEPEVQEVLRATLINLLAIFLLTLVGATVYSRNLLIEPISSLMRATQEIAKGNLGVTLPVTSNSELGVLAATFNTMSGNLSSRTTDLLSANEALRRSEARFELAMQGANDGIWDWDIEGGSVYFSPRWKGMLGYSESDIANRIEAWYALIHPDDKDKVLHALTAHVQGETANLQVEHRLRHQNGAYLWMLTRGASLRNPIGRAIRMAGSQTDISEKVRALALLEERVRERTSELTALLEISNTTALTLELTPLFDLILTKLRRVVEFRGVTVLEGSGKTHLHLLHYAGTESDVPQEWELATLPHVQEALRLRQAVVIENVQANTPFAEALRASYETLPPHVQTWLGLPLIVREKVVGFVIFEHDTAGYYNAQRLELVLAFANQIAVAMENTKLYEQVQEQAALEERQHLARELHDSVSQALYGIVLGAHAARTHLKTNPELAVEPLNYLQNLAQAGIAEMRALIFELRPESLEQEGLVAALGKQADALRVRHQLEILYDSDSEPTIPFPTKQALYRISQEALHNVVKHARATNVKLCLKQSEGHVTLTIEDDGAGFETGGQFPGHLGLKSMRERSEALGGTFRLRSQPGEGTRVQVSIPLESPL